MTPAQPASQPPESLFHLLPDLNAPGGALAFLLGSLYNQQVRSEVAWRAPRRLAERLGGLHAPGLAGADPGQLTAVMREGPAIHPFASTMAARTIDMCGRLLEQYGGHAANVWAGQPHGRDLLNRLTGFAGIGRHKATVAIALLTRHYGLPFADADALADEALSSCPRLSEVLVT
jgi:uncharacterized HhH-GPD family protein